MLLRSRLLTSIAPVAHLAVAAHSDLVFNIHIAAVLASHRDILPLRCHDDERLFLLSQFNKLSFIMERG